MELEKALDLNYLGGAGPFLPLNKWMLKLIPFNTKAERNRNLGEF
jgi:hypothetical protein